MKSPFTHLIFALIVCAFALVGYGAAYAAIASKSADVSLLQEQINAQTDTVNRLTMARATLAELSTDETEVQNYFVPQSGIVSFIDGIEAQGRALGTSIQVQSVSTSGTSVRPALDLSLTIDGPFDGVMRTVGAIEYAPYAISISHLSVDTAGKGWEAQMTLVVGSRIDSAATSTKP